ncbi:MAG: multiheme c-type cytochrome [Bryobacteraceae bacterium]
MFAFLLAFAAPFTGSQACAKCHPAEFRAQSASRHAAALRPARSDLAELLNARPPRERSGVEFSYGAAPEGVRVSITQGKARVDAVLEWAFGAGAQAITPVGRRGGRYFEHRLSWYRAAGHAARTLGHPGEPSPAPAQALGLPQDGATITRCFECHATAVKPGPDLSQMQPGVACERCHGPGAEHAARPSAANIVRLSRRGARESVEFCAECHRSPAAIPAAAPERDDPASIRFQPVGLAASRCFQKSGTLSCLTCHDPHADASRDPGFYAARCLGCHASGGARVQLCERNSRHDCLPCHMAKQSPFPYLTFTDHRIRVYR